MCVRFLRKPRKQNTTPKQHYPYAYMYHTTAHQNEALSYVWDGVASTPSHTYDKASVYMSRSSNLFLKLSLPRIK